MCSKCSQMSSNICSMWIIWCHLWREAALAQFWALTHFYRLFLLKHVCVCPRGTLLSVWRGLATKIYRHCNVFTAWSYTCQFSMMELGLGIIRNKSIAVLCLEPWIQIFPRTFFLFSEIFIFDSKTPNENKWEFFIVKFWTYQLGKKMSFCRHDPNSDFNLSTPGLNKWLNILMKVGSRVNL